MAKKRPSTTKPPVDPLVASEPLAKEEEVTQSAPVTTSPEPELPTTTPPPPPPPDPVVEEPQAPPATTIPPEDVGMLEMPAVDPVAPAPPLPDEDDAGSKVGQHLRVIDEYGEVTVEVFRSLTGTGKEAVLYLKDFVAAGLAERGWRTGSARYKLTAAGKAALKKM